MRAGRLAQAAAIVLALGGATGPSSATDLEVLGGVSIASLTGTAVNGGTSRSGVSVGPQARWPLAPRWSFTTGLAYVERGMVAGDATYLGPAGAGTVKETIELAYAEVPLLFAWSTPRTPGTCVRLFAGPMVAVKLNEWLHQTGVQEVKLRRSDFQDADLLACMGARIEVPWPPRYVFAEGRVDAGLVNELRPTASEGSARTTDLRVMLGCGWPGWR